MIAATGDSRFVRLGLALTVVLGEDLATRDVALSDYQLLGSVLRDIEIRALQRRITRLSQLSAEEPA